MLAHGMRAICWRGTSNRVSTPRIRTLRPAVARDWKASSSACASTCRQYNFTRVTNKARSVPLLSWKLGSAVPKVYDDQKTQALVDNIFSSGVSILRLFRAWIYVRRLVGRTCKNSTWVLNGASRVFAILLANAPTTSQQYSAVATIVQTMPISSSDIFICKMKRLGSSPIDYSNGGQMQ